MSKFYHTLSYDNDTTQRENFLKDKPWKFINLLPFDVDVYVYRVNKTDLIGTIAAQSDIIVYKSKSGMVLQKDDQIHVVFTMADQKSYKIIRPVHLFTDSRMVKIGDIVYEDIYDNRKDIHHDIIGIRIVNHLLLPIDVYHKGNKIGSIAGDDNLSYQSGSPNSVYLNNEWNGFQIGDEIGFVFPKGVKGLPQNFASVQIIDTYTRTINVGVINQHFNLAIQDSYSYRIDDDSITGLTYFDTQIKSAYLPKPVGLKANPLPLTY